MDNQHDQQQRKPRIMDWDGQFNADEYIVLVSYLKHSLAIIALNVAAMYILIKPYGITNMTLAVLCALFVAPYWSVHSTVIAAGMPKIVCICLFIMSVLISALPVFIFVLVR